MEYELGPLGQAHQETWEKAKREPTVAASVTMQARADRGQNRAYRAMIVIVTLYLAIFFIYPLAALVARSFGFPGTLNLGSFREILTDSSYLKIFRVTMEISIISTVVCLLLGYPLALAMSSSGPGLRRVYFLFLIVPFLTSVLIRMFGWIALLSPIGIIPVTLQRLGFGDVTLLYNRFGVIIGMTYALLPYAVFTIYGALQSVDMRLLRASRSLGANGWQTFRRILLPLTLPGVVAAAILTFVLALGYFVTPRLMGGPADQTLASVIQNKMELSQQLSVAVALSLLLLVIVGLGFALASRLIGFRTIVERRAA